MNILFFADPGSIHDEKWIDFFSREKKNTTYILPRAGQMINPLTTSHKAGALVLKPITDFSIVRFYKTIVTAIRIRSFVKMNKIQLIHILYAEPNVLWCLFREFFGIPMIVSCRGTDVLQTIPEVFVKRDPLNYLVALAYRWAFRKADWITGTSNKQLLFVSKLLGGNDKTSIIRTGVTLSTLKNKVLLPEPLQPGDKYILFPRYIKPIYNHEFCLLAIELLPSLIKQNYKMVFLGRNSGDFEYQKKLDSKMKELNSVSFIFLEKQNQDSLFELYKNAALVVMTPHSDGSPVSAMEAVLCGAPVILGPLDYDKELFEESCYILKEWNSAMLAGLINDVLLNRIAPKILSAGTKEMMNRDANMNNLTLLYRNFVYEA